MVGELVNYVILQNPAQSISQAGGAYDWSLQMNIKGNTVFWPQAKDSIANNLFKNNEDITKPLPQYLSGIQYNPDAKPGNGGSTIYDSAKSILNSMSKHPVAQKVAGHMGGKLLNLWTSPSPSIHPSIMELRTEDDQDEVKVVKADYVKTLTSAWDALKSIQAQNPMFSLDDELKRLTIEIGRV